MAKSAKKKITEFLNETIIPMNLEKIVGDRFGKYSKYIIQDRALPDVRDGLKPVQRRILFAMNELGMASDKPFKKSARIVGDVIGKYHPHGDQSVYDAMVRMSQYWKTNALLVDMHGNNGSIDNDPAAAMRYTEARLSVYSEALLQDIDKKTVTFVPNFDDAELEPVVLPAKFPNLLVNGSQGMATGYATNIPPHNFSEVLEATIYRVTHPESNVDDLMAFIKGPDFPTGGIVEGEDEIRKAFVEGKGKIVVKSKVHVQDTSLVIDEIPYEVNKSDLVRKIDDIRLQKKIDGIVEVKDMSDREGLQIIVTLKKEIASDVILAYLFKNTDLKITYNYNVVAISQRSPKQLSLIEILDEFIQHQKEVIRNRSNYELHRAEKRKHIVLGFLNMVDVLDEVIALIRESMGKRDAIDRLVGRFNFTEAQADAIVTLQLYRLSTTDVKEMRKEAAELTKKINRLNLILTNELELEAVIVGELQELHDRYLSPRKTEIQSEIQKVEIDEQELIQNEEVKFVISRDGYIKRASLKSFQATPGDTGLKEKDMVLKQLTLNTRDNILFFTNLGNYIILPAYKVPDLKWRDTGEYLGGFVELLPNERVFDFLVVPDFSQNKNILLANEEGQIKQVPLSEFEKSRINKTYNCMPASKINQLISVDLCESFDRDVVLATQKGYIAKYDIEEVPIQSLNAKGVKGINLRDDMLIGAKYTARINKDEIILLTNRGGLIREFTQNIESNHRPAKGKRYLKSVKSNPYRLIGMVAENVFRLKEDLTIRILAEKSEVVISATDLKPDRYENGIPYIPQSHKPMVLTSEIDLYNDAIAVLEKLAESIDDDEPVPDNDDVMYELEKILSGNKPKKQPIPSDEDYEEEDEPEDEDDTGDDEPDDFEDEEDDFEEEESDDEEDEDLDENVIQQTLF
ncbi:MAG: DNA topoisomerase IV subunit A [Bacilli bacterium]|nr:DNA topoisomerase IV subunit A [Bacilli bacterium]MBN2877046.1 DNA topoisomerase IV subunit A [Bacilli bacterium]